jgi:cell division protein FtsB
MIRATAVVLSLCMAGCIAMEPKEREPVPESWPEVKPPPPPNPEPVVVEPRQPEIDLLLSEFERFRRLSPADLAREQEAARQTFNQTRSDAARLQLAMALSVPGTAVIDETRALDLLEPLAKNPLAPLHGLAFLLSAHIQEQRRLVAQLQGLQQNNQGLQQNVQSLQQNVQGLQQKLDALRTLERSLSERGETPTRKR